MKKTNFSPRKLFQQFAPEEFTAEDTARKVEARERRERRDAEKLAAQQVVIDDAAARAAAEQIEAAERRAQNAEADRDNIREELTTARRSIAHLEGEIEALKAMIAICV